MCADEWVVRAFSKQPTDAIPAGSGFESGTDGSLCAHKPLNLEQPHHIRAGPTAQKTYTRKCKQQVHATFSSQLKAFIPVVVVLVTVSFGHRWISKRSTMTSTGFILRTWARF